MAAGQGSDVRQQVTLEMRGIGGDTVSILAQALQELQTKFAGAVTQFDSGDRTALELIGTLKGVASGLKSVADIANAEADAMAKAEAATNKFIEQTNAALAKKDAEEARLDAEAAKRTEAKAARDQKALDAIGAAADRAAAAATKAADDMAASDARKNAANDKALADMDGYAAMQRKLGEMEKRTQQETREAIQQTVGARQHGTEAIADHIVKTRQESAAEKQLQADLQAATTAIEKEAAAATWMARQARELDEALEGLAQGEREATRAHIESATASGKAGDGVKTAANQSGLSAYKWLLLGNAIQDVQYGFEAIVNNIPGIVMSFGGSAGLAGGIGIAAVAAQQLLLHLGDIKKAFGEELPRHLIYDVQQLQKELKILEDKPAKTRIDYSDIDIAKKKLDALSEAQAAFENLKKRKSKDTIEAGKLASEAIVEAGGGDDFESSAARVARAAAASTPAEESEATRKLREQIDTEEKGLDKLSPESQVARGVLIDELKKKLETSVAIDMRNHVDVAAGMVGRASEGYAGDIRALRELAEKNPRAFAAQGVGPGFVPGLQLADRGAIAERDRRSNAAQIKAEDRAALGRQIDAANAAEAEEIKQAGEEGERLDKAKKKRLAKDAEVETRVAEVERGAGDDAELKDRAAARAKQVADLAPGFLPQLEGAIDQNRLAQATHAPGARREGDVARQLEAQAAQILRQSGQDPTLAHDLVAKAFEKANDDYAKMMAQTGNQVTALTNLINASQADMAALWQKTNHKSMIIQRMFDTGLFSARQSLRRGNAKPRR
jgi:trimeric autotransporter adhesin